MITALLRLQRHIPLIVTAIIVCCVPFHFARAANAPIKLPPTLPTRNDEKAKPQSAQPQRTAPRCVYALEKLLRQYQDVASNGGWPQWVSYKKGRDIRPGASDARMPLLREELTIMGDYAPGSGVSTTSKLYDPTLVSAVKRFQARHGLGVDGRLNKSTQEALTVPVENRITEILATLMRMRAHPLPADERFVLVNLPAYTLTAYDQSKPALTMRVIVGDRKNHTPLFDNAITDVIFNPAWHPPEKIIAKELRPKLQKNPEYFVRAGFTITQDGVPIDPMQANPYAENLTFRQDPGVENALGKIKFNVPDPYDVYLHSTPMHKLFARDDRALSHGCIRLEKPREMAHFVLGDKTGWSEKKINKAYDSDEPRTVHVSSIPVHLVYWTAFVDETGTAHFYNDVYAEDRSTISSELQDTHRLVVAAK